MLNDFREMFAEQLQYRELLYQMTKRDLLLRYKQSVMGFAWAVFMPLVNTVVFSVIFTRVAPIDVGMPYPLFAFIGLVGWNLTSSSLKFAVTSLTSNTSLVTKVYFPREIFPISAVLVTLVDFMVSLAVIVALMWYYDVQPAWTMLLLPAIVVAQVMLTSALALVLSMANLFYRDVKYLFEVVLTVGMFLTAVLYPPSQVGGIMGMIMKVNPLTPILEAYRDVLVRGVAPSLSFVVATSVSLLALLCAWLMFHRAEFQFAENV